MAPLDAPVTQPEYDAPQKDLYEVGEIPPSATCPSGCTPGRSAASAMAAGPIIPGRGGDTTWRSTSRVLVSCGGGRQLQRRLGRARQPDLPLRRPQGPLPHSSTAHGRDELLVFGEDDLNDTRCGVCGSLLFSVVRDGAYVHVAMGSLVDAPSIRPTEHIYVGSKAPWFEITDDLPQFEELTA